MEKCDHRIIHWDNYGDSLRAVCHICRLTARGKTSAEILDQFHPKEKTMSTDYDAGFKAGVEKATQPLYEKVSSATRYFASEINGKLNERRKNLLTKKVTKWVNVYHFESDGSFETNGDFYDSKELAKANIGSKISTAAHLGAFPVEIEIPL